MGSTSRWQTTTTRSAGRMVARLIRFVSRTSRTVIEPATLVAEVEGRHPSILAVWHGQFMMLAHLKRDHLRYAAMVARHGDADLIGEAMAAFGLDLIRGAGAGERERKRDRGGAQALRAAVSALHGSDGKPPASVVMTADVPPGPARRAGEGIVMLARLSGRPIQPIAVASSRYRALRTWSRMTINLPFSTLAIVAAEPIWVPREASAADLEAYRQQVEDRINAATARAYALAGADPTAATPPNPTSRPRDPGLLLAAYRTGMSALQPVAGPILRARLRRGKEEADRLGERRGIAGHPRPAGRLVWVHAASVGETNAVLPLIGDLLAARPDVRLLLTTTTVTSAAIAARRLPADRAVHQYAPLDTPAYAAAFLDHWRPDAAIFTESEVWPSLILGLHARGIPLALVNARLSPRSYRRWMRLRSFAEPLFGRFDVILAQTEKLARQFRDVGGRSVIPFGNLKADAPPPAVDAAAHAALVAALAGRPHLLAASTHPGEEAILAEAHRLIRARLPGFATVIVPRHPDRGAELAADLAGQGLSVTLRSRAEALTPATDVYIADTLGELGTFYAASPVALMGGSLVPHGGQNPFEGVALGSALMVGPHTHNFRAEYRTLADAHAVVTVATAADIARETVTLVSDPSARATLAERGRVALKGLTGAQARTLAAVLPLLPPLAGHDGGAAGEPAAAVSPRGATPDVHSPVM